MGERARHTALVVDYGGVLTTDIWTAFAAFCEGEGLQPSAVRDLLRGDPEALGLLRSLETGEIDSAQFEPRFGALLGLSDHDRLTERRFAGLEPDEAVISGEVGLHKPQPEIYLLACERLGVGPGEAVFVDDLRENCAGAEAVGMTAILHRSSEATVAEIDRLRGSAASPSTGRRRRPWRRVRSGPRPA